MVHTKFRVIPFRGTIKRKVKSVYIHFRLRNKLENFIEYYVSIDPFERVSSKSEKIRIIISTQKLRKMTYHANSSQKSTSKGYEEKSSPVIGFKILSMPLR